MSHYYRKCMRAVAISLVLTLALSGCAAQGRNSSVTEPSEGNVEAQKSEETTIIEDTQATEELEGTTTSKVSGKMESEGFDKPEEALAAYLEGLKEMNYSKMLGCFAVESYVENWDFQSRLATYKAYIPDTSGRYPNINPLLESINIEGRRSEIAEKISNQVLVLGFTDFEDDLEIDSDEFERIDNEAEAKDFTDKFSSFLNGVEPESIKLLGFISPEDVEKGFNREKNIENIARKAEIYGTDKIEDCVAVFEIHGDKWLMCADTAVYNGKWYILNMSGTIGVFLDIPVNCAGMIPVTALETDWESKLIPAE